MTDAAAPRGSSAGTGRVVTVLALLLVLFVSINMIASAVLTSARLDLTEDRLYTLSPSTRALLGKVDETVTFRLYLSSALGQAAPRLGLYANRVRDLLREYESVSGGRVRLEVIDPEPFSDMEDRAEAAGLQAVTAGDGGENLYFGVVGTNTTDDVETIPFMRVDQEQFLEYELSRMLYSLSTPSPTVVGIISTLPTDGTVRMSPQGTQETVAPYVIRSRIGELFETRFLGRQVDEVPEEVTVLVVVHPYDATPRTRFAIDQYLLAGGKAVILVDPYSEAQGMQGQLLGTVLDGSALTGMFEAWGLEFGVGTVVGDKLSARKVLAQSSRRLVEYVPWLELRGRNLNSASPLMSGVELVSMASAGHFTVREDAPVTLTPLLTTSPGSTLFDAAKVQGFRDPERLLDEYSAVPGQRYVVAARVTGEVGTAFPDGLPPPPETDEDDPPAPAAQPWTRPVLSRSVRPIDVVLFGDADLLADRFWVIMQDYVGGQIPVPTASNGILVLNTLEALSGSSTLLELRGRGSVGRPFEVLEGIQRTAERRFADKERELRATLEKTEQDLRALRLRNPEQAATVVSDRDRKQMENFQRKMLQLRAELREVRRSLNEDFERLEGWLWFFNIALAPMIVTAAAIVLAVWRAWRRRNRAYEAVAG